MAEEIFGITNEFMPQSLRNLMDFFHYKNNVLFAEEVAVPDLIQQYGTPCYIYSKATIERHWHTFYESLKHVPHRIHYAVKANSNLAILDLLHHLGAGFDIVSGGELARLQAIHADSSQVIFSGVGKTSQEIEYALKAGIHCFNVESSAELTHLASIAKTHHLQVPIALRVNPNVPSHSHPFITTGTYGDKFGIDIDEIVDFAHQIQSCRHLKLLGLACHLGSQMLSVSPILEALDKLLVLEGQLQKMGIQLQHLNLGGGLGVRYQQESPPAPNEYMQAILSKLTQSPLTLFIEPGRAIMANAGILLTKVLYLKNTPHKRFAIVDAATNDLMRPALYNAYHEIIEVVRPATPHPITYDVVGPICESSDVLGKDRSLCIQMQDALAIRTAGAYAASMSSEYNSRPKIAEVMVDGKQSHLIRQRESWQNLFKSERTLPKETL